MLHTCAKNHWFEAEANELSCPYCQEKAVRTVPQRMGDCIRCSALCPENAYACNSPLALDMNKRDPENGIMVIAGHNVYYRESGKHNQEKILMLSGWATPLETYNEIANFLSSRYHVLQIDLPGFGQTSEPNEIWAVSDYSNLVTNIINTLEWRELTIIGHSYGGRIAIELASQKTLPYKISQLVLIDAAGCPVKNSKNEIKIKTYKLINGVSSLPGIYPMFAEMIDDWKARQGSDDYRNASNVMKGVLVSAVNYDQSNLLPNISIPVSIIWGELDSATPLESGKKMEKLCNQSSMSIISNAGHFPFVDEPDRFFEILGNMLFTREGKTR